MLRLTLRNLMAHKLRLLMSTLAIVLGVGFLSGVLVFSHGMQGTFDNIIKGSTPEATVRPTNATADGGFAVSNMSISGDYVAKLAALPQVDQSHGVVQGLGLALISKKGQIVGGQGAPTLAFNYSDTRNLLGTKTLSIVAGTYPKQMGEILIDAPTAKRAGYRVGDTVSMVSPYGEMHREMKLVGTATFTGGGTAGATLLIFDTKQAQEIFLGGRDAFTSIALNGKPGVSQQALADAAKPLLPAGFTAVTGDRVAKESQSQVGEFLGIISTFLLVFALIAVLVGGFIIVNTFSILVAQRVRELALLRALGARRRQVTRLVLVEAFVMSVVASALGIVLGWLLALGLARLFSSFGLTISSGSLAVTPRTIAISMAVGVVVTVVAAFIPAQRASRVPPVAAMQADALGRPVALVRRTVIGLFFLAIGAGVAGYGVIGAPGNDAIWIGVGAFIWIITVAVISPVIGKPVLIVCRSLFGALFRMPGRLAGDNALRDPRRTGATASALMIGLALVSTIGVLAASMNKSIEDVVDKTFQADFVVQSPGLTAFPVALADAMRKEPGVAALAQQQVVPVKVDGKRTYATATDPTFFQINKLTMIDGAEQPTGMEVLLGNKKAEAIGVGVGDEVTLEFASRAPMKVKVSGIFDEQTAVTSAVTVPFEVFSAAGISRQDTSLSIKLGEAVNTADVRSQLEKMIKKVPIVSLQDRSDFSKSIRGQVDQLLYIIYGLLALAILIAVIGIINTLGLSVLERTREIGLLRAVGLSRSRLRLMVALESVTISLLGAVLGLGLGLVFGSLLRYSMRDQLSSMALPISQLLAFLAIAVLVGLVAAILPAIRASRMKVLEAIAEE